MFKPCVAALSGLPLHGKSEVATYMAKHSNFAKRDVDDFRRSYFAAQSGVVLPEVEEIDIMVRSFRFMMDSVGKLIRMSQSVVLPSTFSRRVFKDTLLEFVSVHPEVSVRVFRFDVSSLNIVEARLKKRLEDGTNSNVRSMERYHYSKTIVEPWPEGVSVIPVNAEGPIELVANSIFAHFRDLEI
ncbi:hypothetical protein A3C20_02460 [Candidatus Kaiserbacteria bacterium RIFCSPHIGHO2_02_FULL_55_25]|uniref:UDP-N-acetylglucosamine kinase n=2 Tax=Parcubacteria group TaxID=1794811 RepID=A0A1F4Y119_9BACT|nr:MAG: hypothetical protein A3B33_02455 [Candidatus Adlerbacteria bacterium RIFCSPLOWO2_01_FULL_54_16]OGG53300.1 MAG: hypothetical protein A2764_03005 [Candidatus Kaiserbacteria bacterium RIFCSPHIGHO2_01_FULL_55_79]OGG69849.1 MAG: hypothetical protein A3C20_02460 [Candidatus Kaiserbacteria bacterium RIFCSPHIGHO2_02_FULL_55_25]